MADALSARFLGLRFLQPLLRVQDEELGALDFRRRLRLRIGLVELRALDVVLRLDDRRVILLGVDLRLLRRLIELGLRLTQLGLLVLQRAAQRQRVEIGDDVALLDGRAVGHELQDLQLAGLIRRGDEHRPERPDVAARLDDFDEVAARDLGGRDVGTAALLERDESGRAKRQDDRRRDEDARAPLERGPARHQRVPGVDAVRAARRVAACGDDFDRRAEVRHQLLVRALDRHERDERSDLRRHRALHAERRHELDPAVEQQIRIRVQTDLRGLARRDRADVRLIDHRAHLHRRRVDDVEDRQAGTDFLAFRDFGHVVALPDLLEDDEAGEGRGDGHELAVALGVAQRALGALALDLEDAQIGGLRRSLERERLADLLEPRVRFLERERVLLGFDLRDQVVAAGCRAWRARRCARPR